MDKEKLLTLVARHQKRELPDNYSLLTPAAEVSALLKAQARAKQAWEQQLAAQAKERDDLLAAVTAVAYFLDEAVTRHQPAMEANTLKQAQRELRVLKDKLVHTLKDAGYSWHDPLGEVFEGDLPGLVSVDGWRLSAEYTENRVTQVREPIVLHKGRPIKEGSVVVSGPPALETDDSQAESSQP